MQLCEQEGGTGRAIDTLVSGNGLVETRSWNSRLQLTGISAAGSAGTALTLGLYRCAGQENDCASGNDGHIKSQTIGLPGLNLTQSYTYDALNQLKTAGEATGSWSQTYGYDNRGNRFVSANDVFPQSPNTPTVSTNFDERNRLFVNGAAYDPSGIGTQTAIGGHLYTFNAENRLVQAAEGTTVAISSTAYVYDGEGQRVRKVTCPA